MSGLLTAVLLTVTTLPGSYDTAYRESVRTGRPLLVLVGASWCGACQQCQQVVPSLQRQGCFAYVDADKEQETISKLAVKKLPTLFIFHRSNGQWTRRTYVGAQPILDYANAKEQ